MNAWTTRDLSMIRNASDYEAAARIVGRSRKQVRQFARRFGVRLRAARNPLKWSDADRARVMRWRASGMSVAAISRGLGIPLGTVRRWVYSP